MGTGSGGLPCGLLQLQGSAPAAVVDGNTRVRFLKSTLPREFSVDLLVLHEDRMVMDEPVETQVDSSCSS